MKKIIYAILFTACFCACIKENKLLVVPQNTDNTDSKSVGLNSQSNQLSDTSHKEEPTPLKKKAVKIKYPKTKGHK